MCVGFNFVGIIGKNNDVVRRITPLKGANGFNGFCCLGVMSRSALCRRHFWTACLADRKAMCSDKCHSAKFSFSDEKQKKLNMGYL